jgi:LuxR family maltose regulon positive regulatory protein
MRKGGTLRDEWDNDPVRFWDYFIAALQTMQPACGEDALAILQSNQTLSSQVPPIESILTILINDLVDIPFNFIVALDDYHLMESNKIHDGIT